MIFLMLVHLKILEISIINQLANLLAEFGKKCIFLKKQFMVCLLEMMLKKAALLHFIPSMVTFQTSRRLTKICVQLAKVPL